MKAVVVGSHDMYGPDPYFCISIHIETLNKTSGYRK